MIVVDSSVRIDYFNGEETRQTLLLDAILGIEPVVIGDLILAEVLQGIRSDRDARRALDALGMLLFEPMVGRDIALASARNYHALRSRGVTVRKTIDMLIATWCMQNRHALLHSDQDFEPIREHLGLEMLWRSAPRTARTTGMLTGNPIDKRRIRPINGVSGVLL